MVCPISKRKKGHIDFMLCMTMFNVNIAYDRVPPFFFPLSIFIDIFGGAGAQISCILLLYFIIIALLLRYLAQKDP